MKKPKITKGGWGITNENQGQIVTIRAPGGLQKLASSSYPDRRRVGDVEFKKQVEEYNTQHPDWAKYYRSYPPPPIM